MRILAFTNLYPWSREPTRGLFNLQAFRVLAQMGEMKIVLPLPWWYANKRPDLGRVPVEHQTGIETHLPAYWSLPMAHTLHAAALHYSVRGLVGRIRQEFPFDVILASWACPDGVAAARLAREFGCPLVTMVLGSDMNELAKRPSLRPQIAWGLSQAERVVAVSRALGDRVTELGIPQERVVVQHNGVDGSRFAPRDRMEVRKRLGLPLDRPNVCFIGNLKPEKGVSVLIEAMGKLRYYRGREDVLLTLIGDGVLEEPLRARVAELRLEDQVRFCGRRKHDETADWIAASDALCLPSYREGCPNVILEALASGRPVVATAVGGVPEIVGDGNGRLVPADSPAALAEGIDTVLRERWEPEALRATVPCLSWEQFGGRIYSALEDAVRDYHPSVARPAAAPRALLRAEQPASLE